MIPKYTPPNGSQVILKLFNLQFVQMQKGFVEANADDGLLEVFGFKHGWHASFVMVELISAKHIAQVLQILLTPIFLKIKLVELNNSTGFRIS